MPKLTIIVFLCFYRKIHSFSSERPLLRNFWHEIWFFLDSNSFFRKSRLKHWGHLDLEGWKKYQSLIRWYSRLPLTFHTRLSAFRATLPQQEQAQNLPLEEREMLLRGSWEHFSLRYLLEISIRYLALISPWVHGRASCQLPYRGWVFFHFHWKHRRGDQIFCKGYIFQGRDSILNYDSLTVFEYLKSLLQDRWLQRLDYNIFLFFPRCFLNSLWRSLPFVLLHNPRASSNLERAGK